MTEIEVLAALGIFFGCLSRTILPFLKKQNQAAKENTQLVWDKRYVWTIILTLFVAMISTMLLLPSFQIPTQYAFPLAFAYGWAANDMINRVAK